MVLILSLFLLPLFIIPDAKACAATATTNIPCQQCAGNLIAKTTNGDGSKEFQSDVTTVDRTTTTCASRTFLCDGDNANIEINNGDGVINDGDDGAVDEVARMTVVCNAAGDAWVEVRSGITITQAECAAG